MMIISYAGDTTTATAKEIESNIARLLVHANATEAAELIKLLLQIQTRNLKFQNVFFAVDWNILIGVSFFFDSIMFSRSFSFYRQHRQLSLI